MLLWGGMLAGLEGIDYMHSRRELKSAIALLIDGEWNRRGESRMG
jgi:hypothetical protein